MCAKIWIDAGRAKPRRDAQPAFTAQARENLREISDFISDESGSEDVAESFLSQLVERCRHIASLPGTLGTIRTELREDIRSTPHKGYVIFFRYQADVLEVVGVLHGSRDIVAYFVGDE